MPAKYQAVLFAPDGHYVTDAHHDTIEEVQNEINDMGSRWIFFPIAFVATENTIVGTPDNLEYLKRKRITTVVKLLETRYAKEPQAMCDEINDGLLFI